ncbi:MAG TPA: tryptophan 7-halogenase [Pyrinomonadaceae bacterium]|nr:tryptophan 7-halogenase [Pyrinomonadaceae bacterium]
MVNACDIAIAGAGPGGAAIARQLAQSGCRVVLLERSRFDGPRVGESLAPAVQPLLTELGVWQEFVDLKPLPSYGTRSVWGGPLEAEHSHLQNPYLCGWHVDRVAFDRMLADSAIRAGAQLLLGTQVRSCVSGANGGFVLSLSEGDELHADFVIDATGRGSTLARRLGAKSLAFDRLVGVAAQFENVRARERCYTLVETTPDGWWYSAPVGNDHSVVMLMTDGDLVPLWSEALGRAGLTHASVDGCEMKWGPRVFSAVSRRLQRTDRCRKRWLAVGDAALAVDPISGSGVVRALRTARAAAATVLASLSGDESAIASYEADRDNECTEYLFKRAGYYGLERRWPNSPFWRRRLDVLAKQRQRRDI